MKTLTSKEKKYRRMISWIPIVILPFVCVLFWALGGGARASAHTQDERGDGLNTSLPAPVLDKEQADDKMSFYQQAITDSIKRAGQMDTDPFYHNEGMMDTGYAPQVVNYGQQFSGDPNVDKVNQRLARIYAQVNSMNAPPEPGEITEPNDAGIDSYTTVGRADPEMEQLDGMLEKILDIQDPVRSREKARERSLKNKKQVYSISSKPRTEVVTLLEGDDARSGLLQKPKKVFSSPAGSLGNSFYSWTENGSLETNENNTASAIIQQTSTVISGSTIKMRLTDDIYLHGALIQKGTLVYGGCTLSGDRLMIQIQSIRSGNSLFPVNLTAYDIDGIAGIYMPGALSRDVGKNTAQDAVQGVGYYAMDNSLSAQATSVGLQAAKSLLTKKAKLVKVTVRAGYKLLLKDSNAQD